MSETKPYFVVRLGKILFLVVYVFAVLISFPDVQPYVFAISYLMVCLAGRSRIAAIGFSLTPILLCLKLPFFSTAFVVLVVFQILCSIYFWTRLGSVKRPSQKQICLVLAWPLLWAWFTVDMRLGQYSTTRISLEGNKSIVCLGDSLTDYGYPDELAKLTELRIADFGQDGIETADGVRQLADMLKTNPQVVVIELGGHDYNKGKPRSTAESNLRILIEEFQSVGAAVILVEIPRGFISDPFCGLERQLAREYDLKLIPDTMIRRFIFWSPIIPPGSLFGKDYHLSSDGLHPNNVGNQLFAEYVVDAIRQVDNDSEFGN